MVTNRLRAPVNNASLAAFRVLFGALMAAGCVRYFTSGWIADWYLQPKVLFPHYPFEWLRPLPGPAMYALFAVLGVAALCIMLGLFYRASVLVFFLGFNYVHLLDRTHYLNHYYLIAILAGLMLFMPLHRRASLDVRWGRVARSDTAPLWVLWALRTQIGLVYFFGGVAKLNGDWLLRAEPVRFWLAANTDLPLVGPWLDRPWLAYVFSWAGAMYDLSMPLVLTNRRTRPYAYVAVIGFHLITARLFQLGVLPFLMIFSTLIFFAPDWPERLFRKQPTAPVATPLPRSWSASVGLALLAVHFLVQLAMPLRHAVYPGTVAWHEQGFRFSWNFMRIEKMGDARFYVVDRASGRRRMIDNSQYLCRYQEKMMATQPDMILQFARHLRRENAQRGVDVSVYVDAFVSLNGRPPQRLVDPNVDLSREEDGFRVKNWILSASL
jgi:vitamin K-dependent gamma-carboxylase